MRRLVLVVVQALTMALMTAVMATPAFGGGRCGTDCVAHGVYGQELNPGHFDAPDLKGGSGPRIEQPPGWTNLPPHGWDNFPDQGSSGTGGP